MYNGGYTWGPIGGQADWTWTQGGKGKGKGKGLSPYSNQHNKGKGKSQMLGKENRELDKSMKQVHKKIALLQGECDTMAQQVKVSEVNSRDTPAKFHLSHFCSTSSRTRTLCQMIASSGGGHAVASRVPPAGGECD